MERVTETVTDRVTETTSEPLGRVAVGAGAIGALIVGGLLAHVRGDAGSANVALALACVVIGAALAGRLAGAATAVTAALSYDYFHTKPYYSLRVHTARDIVTVALLLAIGLAVSEASAWRRRARAAAQRQHDVAGGLEAVAGRLAEGATAAEIWPEMRAVLVDQLHLTDCRFEPGTVTSAAVLPRSGALTGSSLRFRAGALQLPAGGAAIAVRYADRVLGHIVLVPDDQSGSALDARRMAVALADLYAVALTTALTRHAG